MITMSVFDSEIKLPDDTLVLPEEALDEHSGVYRVALSDMWFDDIDTKKKIKDIIEQIQKRSKTQWLRKVTFTFDNGTTVVYTMVYFEVSTHHGYTFIELESGLNGVKVKDKD